MLIIDQVLQREAGQLTALAKILVLYLNPGAGFCLPFYGISLAKTFQRASIYTPF